MANDILIQPGSSTIHFSGSADSDIKLEVLASGSVQFTGESGSLLTISDSYSGSLFNVNDITGIPILDVHSDDTVTLGQFSSPIKILTNSSGHTMVSGSSTSTGSFGKIEGSVTIPSGKALKTSLIRGGSPVTIDATSLRIGTGGMSDVYSNNLVITSNAPAIFLGDTDVTNLRHSIVGGGNAGLEISADIHNSTTGYINFAVGGSTVARMIEGGNVGIGTVSPSQKLHVQGNLLLGNDSGAAIYFTEADSTVDEMMIGYDQSNSRIRFRSNAHSADRMVIEKTGNVGIGTASPNANARLHIYKTGNNHLWIDSDGTADVGVFGRHNGTAIFGIFDDHSDSKLRIVNYQAEAIEFSTDRGGTENVAMTILDSGNVGIGTVTPDNKLEIRGGELKITDGNPEIIFERQSDGLRSYIVGDGVGRFNFSYHTRNSGEYVQIDTNASGGSFVRNIGSGYLTLGSNSHDQLSLLANGNVSITKDLVVAGSITAQEFITELNTVTIIESSGSTKFGNTLDDTHQITGSLTVTGSGNGVFKVPSRAGVVPVFQINNATAQANSVGIMTEPTNGVLDIRTTGQDRFILNLKNASGNNIGGFYTTGNRGIVQMRNSSGQAKVNLDSGGTSYLTGGSVGIGTNSPHANATLNVENTSGVAMIYITSAANNDTSLVFEEDATAKWMMGHDTSNSDAFTISDGNGFASGTKFTILSSGNVGINRTSPGYKFEVGGVILGTGGVYSYATVLAGNSTDGLPSFAMANDPDTGWRSDLSNNMRFITGGTARMVLDSSGNLGIGITSPTFAAGGGIHLKGSSSAFTSLRISVDSNTGVDFSSDSNGHGYMYNRDNSALIFGTNNTERMRILNSGNVGINESSPVAKLHVSTADSGITPSSIADDLFVENNTHGGITIGTPNSVSGYLFFADPQDNAGAGINYNHATNNMSIAAGGTTRMVVSGSGRVGIGTTTPTEALTIRGNSTGTNGFAYPSIAGYTLNTKLYALEQHFGYEGRLGLYESGNLKVLLRANGTSYINNGNNFGIGTTSPVDKLTVSGNVTQIDGSPEYHFGTTSATHYNWRIAAQETVDGGFEIASGTQSAGTNAPSDSYSTRFIIAGSTGKVSIGTTATYGQVTIGNTGEQLSLRAASGKANLVMYESGTGRATLQTIGGQGGLYIKTPTAIAAMFLGNLVEFPTAAKISGSASSTGSFGMVNIGTEQLKSNFSSSIAGRVATLDAASSGITISNNANNRVLTGDGSNANAEANLTFDGTSLGVGTSSPGVKLDVVGGGTTEARVKATSSGRARLNLDGYSDIAEIYFALNGSNKGAIYQNSAGTNLNVYSFANNTAIMTFDYANDRVGIGDTTPDDRLTVYGGTQHIRVGSADANHLRIGRNTSTGAFEILRTLSGVTNQVIFQASEANNGNISFPNGNVGIGTTVAPEALTIGTISGAKNIAVSIYSYFGSTYSGLWTLTGFNAKVDTGGSGTDYVHIANTHGSAGYAYTLHRGYTNGITFHTAGGSTTAGTNIFETNERMRIDSIGNVGIGVIPEATSTSHTALQIGGNAIITSYKAQGASGEVDFGHNYYYAQSGLDKYISTDEATKFRLSSGHFRFYTAPSGTAGNTVTFTERLTILQGGNVGIGDSTPSYKLEVNGTLGVQGDVTVNQKNIKVYSSAYGSNGLIRFFGTDNAEKLQIGTSSSTTAFIWSPSGVGQTIYAGGSANIYHLASGNVGIGASPSFKLDVSGTTRVTGVARFDSTMQFNGNQTIETVGGSDSLYINPHANLHLGTTSTDHTYIGATNRNVTINATTTAIAGQLNANGNLTVTGTSTFNIDGDSQFKIEDAGTNAVMLRTGASDELYFGSNNTWQLRFLANGSAVEVQNGIDFNPNTDSSSALGTTSQRWSNLFTDAATVGGTLTAGVFKASGDLDLYSGGNKLIGATNTNIGLLRNTSVSGDLSVTGTITAQEFRTEFLTQQVIFESGSTIFGNSADDIHQFTGSLKLKGTADLGSGGELKTSKITGTSPLSINAGGDRVSVTGSLSTTGAVGIGKAAPADSLHVAGGITLEAANAILALNVTNTTGACQIRFGDTGDSDIGKIVYGHNTNAMSFNTADAERLRIDSSGKVGIGTTTPTAVLHVSGASNSHLIKVGTPQTSDAFFFYNGSDVDNGYFGLKNTSGTLTNYLHTKGSATLGNATNNNIGIGGDNAGNSNFKLQIREKSDANAAIRFVDTDDMVWGWVGPARGTNQIVTGTTNGDFVIGNAYTVDTHLVTNSNIRMTIDQNGNVGINDTTPGYKLDVNGDGRFTGALSGNAGLTITGAHSTFTGTIYAEQGATTTLNGHGANLGGVLDLSLGSQASNRGTRILLNSGHSHGEFVIQARQSSTYSTGNISFYRRSAVTTFSELLHIGGNGNIGINMAGNSPEQNFDVIGNIVHRTYSQIKSRKTTLREDGTINSSGTARYYRLRIPMTDGTEHTNGGMVNIRVIWHARHASRSTVQEYEFVYTTDHTRTSNNESFGILDYRRTKHIIGKRSYSAYEYTAFPNVTIGLITTSGIGGVQLKVEGYRDSTNTQITVIAEVDGNSNAIPTLTDMGTSAESTSAIDFYDQAGGSRQGVPGIMISGSIGSVNQRNHVGIMTDTVQKPQSRLHIESEGNGNAYGSCVYLHGDTATNYPVMRIDNATGGNGNETHGLLINNTAAGAGLRVNDGTSTAAFIVDGSGKVGVGTDGPTQMLHVHAGDILMTGGPSDQNPIAAVRWTYSTESSFGTSGKIDVIRNDADQGKGGDMRFFTQADNTSNGGTERFRIDAAGQLIIRANNKYLFGLTTGNATVALIGMDTGNYVRLAAAGYGVRTANGNWSLDGADNMTVNANAYFKELLYHAGDTDTYIHFLDDRLILFAGGDNILDYEEDAASTLKLAGGGEADVTIGDPTTFFIGGSQGSYDAKVGMGTSSPEAIGLHIQKASTDTSINLDDKGHYHLVLQNNDAASTNTGRHSGIMMQINSNSAAAEGTIYTEFEEDGGAKLHFTTTKSGTGQERMVIDSDGKVGIGNTSPDAPLDVSTAGGSGTAIILRNTSTIAMAINANADGSFRMFDYVGGGYNGSIASSGGNIGIGNASPQGLLQVGGSTNGISFDIMPSWNRMFLGQNVKASSTNGRMVRIASSTTDYPSAIAFGYQDVGGFGSEDSKGGINFITVGSNLSTDIDPETYSRMYIHKDGNIGIGTVVPKARLQVHRQGATLGQWTHTAIGIHNDTTNNTYSQLGFGFTGATNNAPAVIAYHNQSATAYGQGSLIFGLRNSTSDAAPSERVRIQYDGKVGIGTTTVEQAIHIASAAPKIQLQDTSVSNLKHVLSGADGNAGMAYEADVNNVGAGYHAFKMGGAERIRFIENGSVGIGTTSPDVKLHLHHSSAGSVDSYTGVHFTLEATTNAGMQFLTGENSDSRIWFGDAANTTAGGILYTHNATATSEHMELRVNAATRVKIMGSGNVGIGTTNPGYPLHVYNLGTGLKVEAAGQSPFTQKIAEFKYIGNGNSLFIENIGGRPAINTNGGNLTLGTQGYARQIIDSSGRIGIGIQPEAWTIFTPLRISTSAVLTGRANTNQTDLANNWYYDGSEKRINTGYVVRYTQSSTGDHQFYTAGTDSQNSTITFGQPKLHIDNGGNVGIGTATPADPLHIYGGSGSTINFDTNGSSNWRVGATTTGGGYSTGNAFAWYCFDSSTYEMTLTTGGNLGIGITTPLHTLHIDGDQRIHNGSLGIDVTPSSTDGVLRAGNDVIAYYSSDERLKENVKQIENPIEKVKQLRGVEFDWIVDEKIHPNKGHDIGVIAQDVEKVLPEIVETRKSGYKAVKYEKMVSLLIESVKEQQKQIEELKSEIQELKDGSSK